MIQANRMASWGVTSDLAPASPGSPPSIPYVQEIRTWTRNNPQLAICGAILLGVGLGWVMKKRAQ